MPRDGHPYRIGESFAKNICRSFGDVKGFLGGYDTIEKMMTTTGKRIYWTEGPSDMLAAMSRFPDELFVSNGHGAMETLSKDQEYAILTGDHKWFLIGDADIPGISGMTKRAAAMPCEAQIFVPPYEIQEKDGKDYRDYLNENNLDNPLQGLEQRRDHLEALEKQAQEVEVQKEEEEMKKQMEEAHKMLKDLGIFILGVNSEGGIEVYSKATQATKTLGQTSKLYYDDMVQLFGPRFKLKVARTAQDLEARGGKGYILSTVRTSIALASTDVRYGNVERVGPGIWPVIGEDRDRTHELLIVKHGKAITYNGQELTDLENPVVGRMSASLSTKLDWFDDNMLKGLIGKAKDKDWRHSVYTELYTIISRWEWSTPLMVELVCGLYMASWIQSLLEWRPIVAVVGESNSGKTELMKLLDKLYLDLASFSAGSTAAGVLQSLGDGSRPLLLDEFDQGAEQENLLKRFRVGSRGQESLYGTSSQGGRVYRIHHIPWISGIYADSRAQADKNRMINLKLTKAPKSLRIPKDSDLYQLGHRLLAGVIASTNDSLDMIERLSRSKDNLLASRYRESFSIPYGILGGFLDLERGVIEDIMLKYLQHVVANEVVMYDAETDQENILLDILGSEIKLPRDFPGKEEVCTVAELLFEPQYKRYRDLARTKGVGYIIPKKSAEIKVAFIERTLTQKGGILRGTEWQNKRGLTQILERLPRELRPAKEKHTVAGNTYTCISVHYAALREWCKRSEVNAMALGLNKDGD